ncbi:unnamed protein product [Echinostoma caproni]|uniref:DUF4206 domain-containing protein n=1 Tax=Echinostoma caproni TaxID=27848 RepID=A0A183AUE5_9TREM|nr:unnamed protein product [Echinostoma caproni]
MNTENPHLNLSGLPGSIDLAIPGTCSTPIMDQNCDRLSQWAKRQNELNALNGLLHRVWHLFYPRVHSECPWNSRTDEPCDLISPLADSNVAASISGKGHHLRESQSTWCRCGDCQAQSVGETFELKDHPDVRTASTSTKLVELIQVDELSPPVITLSEAVISYRDPVEQYRIETVSPPSVHEKYQSITKSVLEYSSVNSKNSLMQSRSNISLEKSYSRGSENTLNLTLADPTQMSVQRMLDIGSRISTISPSTGVMKIIDNPSMDTKSLQSPQSEILNAYTPPSIPTRQSLVIFPSSVLSSPKIAITTEASTVPQLSAELLSDHASIDTHVNAIPKSRNSASKGSDEASSESRLDEILTKQSTVSFRSERAEDHTNGASNIDFLAETISQRKNWSPFMNTSSTLPTPALSTVKNSLSKAQTTSVELPGPDSLIHVVPSTSERLLSEMDYNKTNTDWTYMPQIKTTTTVSLDFEWKSSPEGLPPKAPSRRRSVSNFSQALSQRVESQPPQRSVSPSDHVLIDTTNEAPITSAKLPPAAEIGQNSQTISVERKMAVPKLSEKFNVPTKPIDRSPSKSTPLRDNRSVSIPSTSVLVYDSDEQQRTESPGSELAAQSTQLKSIKPKRAIRKSAEKTNKQTRRAKSHSPEFRQSIHTQSAQPTSQNVSRITTRRSRSGCVRTQSNCRPKRRTVIVREKFRPYLLDLLVPCGLIVPPYADTESPESLPACHCCSQTSCEKKTVGPQPTGHECVKDNVSIAARKPMNPTGRIAFREALARRYHTARTTRSTGYQTIYPADHLRAPRIRLVMTEDQFRHLRDTHHLNLHDQDVTELQSQRPHPAPLHTECHNVEYLQTDAFLTEQYSADPNASSSGG